MISTTCKKITGGTGGLALANFGLSLMIYGLSRYQYVIVHHIIVLGFVYAFMLFGLLNVLLYLTRLFAYLCTDIHELYQQDWSKPFGLSTVGAFSMAICLLGKCTWVIEELGLPFELSLSIVVLGMTIQIIQMVVFLRCCWQTSTWPEPFFNNSLHSCMFVPVCLPGAHFVLQTLRDIFLVGGLVMLFPSCIIMFYRVLRSPIPLENHHNKDQPNPSFLIVANNPSVAMMQAAFSISAAAWFCSPLTGFNQVSPSYGAGGAFGQFMFGLSTFGFLCTLIAIWQRRVVLYRFGGSPMWAGITFPFANTALTAGLYGRVHPEWLFDPGVAGQALRIWILLLSALAATCILSVNILYVRNLFFAFPAEIAPKVVAVATVESGQPIYTPRTFPVLV